MTVTDGTLVTVHAAGSPGWATPLLTRQVRNSIADLDRLRACLDTA